MNYVYYAIYGLYYSHETFDHLNQRCIKTHILHPSLTFCLYFLCDGCKWVIYININILWICLLLLLLWRFFNATRHPRHIEVAAIVMYMYLYSLAFMDHPCTRGAAVCHHAPPCPLYTQPRPRWVWARRSYGLKIVSTREGFEPTILLLKIECANH